MVFMDRLIYNFPFRRFRLSIVECLSMKVGEIKWDRPEGLKADKDKDTGAADREGWGASREGITSFPGFASGIQFYANVHSLYHGLFLYFYILFGE